MNLQPGDWTRLGPTLQRGGIDFAVFAPSADRVDLCLFDPSGAEQIARMPLPTVRAGVHAGLLPGAGAGTVYGFRALGPHDPERGLLFDPEQILLDPYAPRVLGEVTWTEGGAVPPRGVAVEHAFDWRGDRPPRTPWKQTVIYEAHVKGLTVTHGDIPEPLRGTYLGLAHPFMIEHLVSLGVTAVQLLPVMARASERRLQELGLSNYWGYGTLGFFAPDPRFASVPGREVTEFKAMVRALHNAGIEVLLDVVYNHTIEGPTGHPALSLRGLANAEHYRLERGAAVDWTGCGNTLDLSRRASLRLVLDSMRAWVADYHVDGFRFDLAPALFRDRAGVFQPHGRFAAALEQDPVLSGVKLIAEPWDLGPDGYKLGEFPPPFREWNDRFRDTARRFWRGDGGQLPELASRLSGSEDTFGGAPARGPLASINYVACHDGFTLADLVAYERKRNDANGEQGRDGSDQNWSRAWGGEGPSDDPDVIDLRGRVSRSLLATAALSLGVPMLAHGDELGRTQRGNNNAYCQDNPTSWIDWDGADRALVAFVGHLLALRAEHPQLRSDRFLLGQSATWLHPQGREMGTDDWRCDGAKALGLMLAGPKPVCLLLSGHERTIPFDLAPLPAGEIWIRLDTSRPSLREESAPRPLIEVPAHSFLLLEVRSTSTFPQPSR